MATGALAENQSDGSYEDDGGGTYPHEVQGRGWCDGWTPEGGRMDGGGGGGVHHALTENSVKETWDSVLSENLRRVSLAYRR